MLYSQVKPLLARIQSPEQLRQIELNSPQIQGDNAELWHKLIARDVPTWHKKNYKPKNPNSWYKIYKRYVQEQKEEIERDQQKLRETMQGLKSKQTTSQLVNLKSVPVPRDPRMRITSGVPRKKTDTRLSTLNFTAGSKTKMVDAKSVLNRARREAKEIHAMGRLNKLTHHLTGKSGQVVKAPEGMRREYEIKAQPELIKVLSSKRKIAVNSIFRDTTNDDLSEREARLRRAMQPIGSKRDADGAVKNPNSNFLHLSEDEESLDDLFDEPPLKRVRPSTAADATSAKAKPVSETKAQMLAVKKAATPFENSTAAREPTNVKKPQSPAVPRAVTSFNPPVRQSSPVASSIRRPPPGNMFPKKKKAVDIFNRRPAKRH